MPCIQKPTNIVQIDYVMFTHKDMDNEVVYKVAKALATNQPMLAKSMGAFKRQKPEAFGVSTAAPYHPRRHQGPEGAWAQDRQVIDRRIEDRRRAPGPPFSFCGPGPANGALRGAWI